MVGEGLGERVVGPRGPAPAAGARGAARGSASGSRRRRSGTPAARGPPCRCPARTARLGLAQAGDDARDAVVGRARWRARTRRPCRRPRCRAPGHRAHRDDRRAPARRSRAGRRRRWRPSGEGRGRLGGAVAHLDAGVLEGAAHPHGDGGRGVQEGVGDQLGDAELGALDEIGAADVGQVSTTQRRASCTDAGPGPKDRAGLFSGTVVSTWVGSVDVCPASTPPRSSPNPIRPKRLAGSRWAPDQTKLAPDWSTGGSGRECRTAPGSAGTARSTAAGRLIAWQPQSAQDTGRHQVVIIGSGFGGLFGTKALRRADVDVTMVAKTTTTCSSRCSTRWRPASCPRARSRPPTREVLSGQEERAGAARRGHRDRPRARTVTSHVLGRETVTPYDSPDRGRRCRPVLLRQRPLRRVRPRHEEHRRRARAARPHLRRLRDGRARRQPGRRRRPPADLRGRRRRPDRRGDGRPDRRAGAPHAAARLPVHQHPHARVDPGRRRPAGAAAVRREARRQDQGRAGEARRRGPARRDGDRRRRARHRGEVQGRPRPSGSTRSPRSGPPASRPARSGGPCPSRPAPRSTAPAGSASTPTSRCRGTPRCSWSAT